MSFVAFWIIEKQKRERAEDELQSIKEKLEREKRDLAEKEDCERESKLFRNQRQQCFHEFHPNQQGYAAYKRYGCRCKKESSNERRDNNSSEQVQATSLSDTDL